MTNHTDLIARLRTDPMFDYTALGNEAADALEAAQAEIERLTADRRVLQADGKHPAPCAKFCEATAFTIELRRAQAEIDLQAKAYGLAIVERDQALARLAELAKQEPVGYLYDWVHSSATGRDDETYTGFTKDKAHAEKNDNAIAIYAAAGAPPVQPSQAVEHCLWARNGHQPCQHTQPAQGSGWLPTRITLYAAPAVQPSQAGELSDEEIEAVAKPFIRSVGGYWENEPAIPDDGHVEEFACAIIAAINAKGAK